MTNWTVLLTVVMLLSLVGTASADRYSILKCGDMKAGFNNEVDGLSVSYKGVRLVRNSTLWIHNPAWTYHYYGLPHMKDEIKVQDVEGGKQAIITHRSEWFDGLETITVKDRQVSVEFKYKLIKDADDADMEYCFGNVCAAPIAGRPFKAVDSQGVTKEGTVPVKCVERGIEKNILVPGGFGKLEIDSRIGKVTFEVSGEPSSIQIFDNRLSPYEEADQMPVFWCGVLGTHLESGKEYTQTITLTVDPIPAADEKSSSPVRKQVSVVEKDDLRAPSSEAVYVIPEPQEMKLTDGDFVLDENTKIVVGDRAYSEDYRGAQSFANEIELLHGFKPQIIRESEISAERSVILVGEAGTNVLLSTAVKESGLTAPDKEEGYALQVTPDRVIVVGHDKKGTYYGMQTLKQLVKASAKNVSIQGCVINDWPSLKLRGVHLFTGNRALPFHKKLIDRIFSRFKMNHLILEVDFIKWKSDPELAVEFSEDQEDVKREIKFAEDRFMEVSPLLQSLGHCDWMFTNGKNKDMAENPEKPYSYCPSHPRIYDYVFKFYDETVELFNRPKFIHIGHDEVTEPGGFPRHEECKKRSAEEIFVDDVLKVREHLAKYGARIMMWGDMMLSKGDAPDATNAKSPEHAKWIRDQLPKDVFVTDWHYAPGKPEEFKSIDIFTKEGHDTVAATWYTPSNIEAFSKQAKNVGALGLLQTTWAGFNSTEDNLKGAFVQFATMILAAEYSWNSGKTDLDHLPYKWDEEFRRQWDPKPVDRTARKGFVVDLSPVYNVSLADNEKKTGWMGFGFEDDMSAVPTGEVRLGGDLFKMAGTNENPSAVRLASSLDIDKAYSDSVRIDVGRKAKSLLFLHTCAWTDQAGRKVGTYNVHYSDGTLEEIPILYGVNTSSWLDKRSVNGSVRTWEGRTKSGQKTALQKLLWENRHPDKEIASIEFTSAKTEAGPVILAVSGLE